MGGEGDGIGEGRRKPGEKERRPGASREGRGGGESARWVSGETSW